MADNAACIMNIIWSSFPPPHGFRYLYDWVETTTRALPDLGLEPWLS